MRTYMKVYFNSEGASPGTIVKKLKELGWKTTRGIDEMCADTWRWQSSNPNGYLE